jgi:purine-binding chemotaxis protein CheW
MQVLDMAETDQTSETHNATAQMREFVAFGLADEEYAVDINAVREIRSFMASTSLPDAPPHVIGVVNLRGAVVPIMSLRERFGREPVEPDRKTVVIILHYNQQTIGLLVDAVSDILRVENKDIQPAPEFDRESGAGSVGSMIILEDRLVGILLLDQLLAGMADFDLTGEAA